MANGSVAPAPFRLKSAITTWPFPGGVLPSIPVKSEAEISNQEANGRFWHFEILRDTVRVRGVRPESTLHCIDHATTTSETKYRKLPTIECKSLIQSYGSDAFCLARFKHALSDSLDPQIRTKLTNTEPKIAKAYLEGK